MRMLFTLLLVFSGVTNGQILYSGAITIPYDDIYPSPLNYSVYSGGGSFQGSVSARIFFTSAEVQGISDIDTVFCTARCRDLFQLPGFEFGFIPKFKVYSSYNDFIAIDSIYSLPTSRFWRRRNYGQQFCYADCEMTMVVKDLGLHDAHLIHRTARRRKDMFVDRQVRVLLVEEIVSMRYLEPQQSSDDAQQR